MSQTSKPPNLEFSQLGLVFPSMAYDFLVVCSEYRVAAASQDSFTRVMSSRMGWQFRLQHRAGDLMSCEVCVFISGVVQEALVRSAVPYWLLVAQGYVTCSSHEILSRTVATVGFATKFLLGNYRSFKAVFSTGPCKQADGSE